MTSYNYKLTVKNVRPFGQNGKESVFNLKPITILIGPNNSGKSTLIKLIKCICKNLDSGNFRKEHAFDLSKGFDEKTTFANLISSDASDDFIKIAIESNNTCLELILKEDVNKKHFAYISEMRIKKSAIPVPDSNEANISYIDLKIEPKIEPERVLYQIMSIHFDDKEYFKTILKILDIKSNELEKKDNSENIDFNDFNKVIPLFNKIKKENKFKNVNLDNEKRDFYFKNNNSGDAIFFKDLIIQKFNNPKVSVDTDSLSKDENDFVLEMLRRFSVFYNNIINFENVLSFPVIDESSDDRPSDSAPSYFHYNQFSGIEPVNFDEGLVSSYRDLLSKEEDIITLETEFNFFLKDLGYNYDLKLIVNELYATDRLFDFSIKKDNDFVPLEAEELEVPYSMFFLYFLLFLFSKREELKNKLHKDNYLNIIKKFFENESDEIHNFPSTGERERRRAERNERRSEKDRAIQLWTTRSNSDKNENEIVFVLEQVLKALEYILENIESNNEFNDLIRGAFYDLHIIDNYYYSVHEFLTKIIDNNIELKKIDLHIRGKIDGWAYGFQEKPAYDLYDYKKIKLVTLIAFSIMYNLSNGAKYRRFIENNLSRIGFDVDIVGNKLKISKIIGYDRDGEQIRSDITNFGSGLQNFIRFIIFIGTIPFSKHNFAFIEEPESNQHPNRMKEYAKYLMSLFDSDKGGLSWFLRKSCLLIETHSEYLIRNLQLLVAEKIKEEAKAWKEEKDKEEAKARKDEYLGLLSNIVVDLARDEFFYFDTHFDSLTNDDLIIIYNFSEDAKKDDYVKEIKINPDGFLSDDFGPGFYDEAANLIYELYAQLDED